MECASGGFFDIGFETPTLIIAISTQWQSFARIIMSNSMGERTATIRFRK